jgi:hypothetical protein
MGRLLIAGLTVASLTGIAYAQIGLPMPGQGMGAGFSRRVSADGRSAYEGRADTIERGGPVTTYRGNVSMAFPDASIRVIADEAVFNADGTEVALSGNVRIVLDTPSARP